MSKNSDIYWKKGKGSQQQAKGDKICFHKTETEIAREQWNCQQGETFAYGCNDHNQRTLIFMAFFR